jgi:hypothetical protein
MSVESIMEVAQDFLLQTGETITLDASVPEMVETLARLCPVFGAVGVIYNDSASVATPQRFFLLPDNVLQLLSVHFFPRELEPAGVRWAQDTLDPAWRTRTGMPTRYTQELETTRLVRLHPSPTMSGPQGIPPFVGIPGAMVPTNHLVIFVLEAPDVVDLSPWWEDLVAYLLAAWEGTREGLRQDVAQAQALQMLVGLLVSLFKDLAHEPGEELIETAWQIPLWMNLPLT